jgi:hypothetical protein
MGYASAIVITLVVGFLVYLLTEYCTNRNGYDKVINATHIVVTNPIGAKMWGDRGIDSNGSIDRIWYRIEWTKYIERYSSQINQLFEDEYLTCTLSNYADAQADRNKISFQKSTKSMKDFELDIIERIINYINKSEFSISPDEYFASHEELLKSAYHKINQNK